VRQRRNRNFSFDGDGERFEEKKEKKKKTCIILSERVPGSVSLFHLDGVAGDVVTLTIEQSQQSSKQGASDENENPKALFSFDDLSSCIRSAPPYLSLATP
jgi:hypothetical protein